MISFVCASGFSSFFKSSFFVSTFFWSSFLISSFFASSFASGLSFSIGVLETWALLVVSLIFSSSFFSVVFASFFVSFFSLTDFFPSIFLCSFFTSFLPVFLASFLISFLFSFLASCLRGTVAVKGRIVFPALWFLLKVSGCFFSSKLLFTLVSFIWAVELLFGFGMCFPLGESSVYSFANFSILIL